MKKSLIILMALAASAANAQGFQDEPTCYSWNGGHKSAGSFSKCPQPFVVAKAPAPPPPAPVVAAPVMQSCPPQITVIPEPQKPKVLRKRPPPVKC